MDLESLWEKIWSWLEKLFRMILRFLSDFIRKPSLSKTAVVTMLAISILPIFLVGTVAALRSRTQVRELTSRQLATLVDTNAQQLLTLATTRSQAIDNLAGNPIFIDAVKTLVSGNEELIQSTDARLLTSRMMRDIAAPPAPSEVIFTQMFLVKEDRTVLSATETAFIDRVFFGMTNPIKEAVILNSLAQNTTFTAFGQLAPDFNRQMVLVAVRAISFEGVGETITLFGITSTPLIARALSDVIAFFPESRAYYLTKDGNFIGPGSNLTVQSYPPNPSVTQYIDGIRLESEPSGDFNLVSYNQQPVFGHARYIPELDTTLALEVPVSIVQAQSNFIDPVTGIVFLVTLALAGTMIYVGATQLVNPILALTQVARNLTDGNLETRSTIKRKDEIGILASSMNQMADELGHMYQTMEQQVEHRTSQLRTASEVAQLAISTTHLGETLERTTELVNERFGYYHTSIYLMEQNGIYIALSEASGEAGQKRLERGERIPVGDPSPVGWVARNNQPRIINDVQEDPAYRRDETLPDVFCEAAIPITVGSQVLGVLDIRTNNPEPISPDEIFVLQTLANQVAGAIQNIRLLETAQVDLEETSLLYQVTRQVAQSHDESEIINVLIENLPKIPHTNALLTLEGSNLRILNLYDRTTNKIERGLQSIAIPAQKMLDRLNTGEMVFVDNIAQPSDFDNVLSFFLRRSCKSAAIFPSLESGRLSKVIILGFRAEDRVGREIIQPFTNLAEVMTTTFDRFSVLHTLQDRLSELQILANFSQATSAETNLDRLYQVLHQQVMQTLGSDLSFAITLYSAKTNQIEIPYAYEDRTLMSYESFPLGEGLTSLVIQNRQPLLLVENTEQRARELGARFVGKPAKSWMGVPLIVAGDLVGALVIQDTETENRFSQHDLNLFSTLGTQIATSIRNAQLVDEMQDALRAYDQERQFLNSWLQNTPDVIAIKDAEGQYLRASQSLAAQFNLVADDMIGKTDFSIYEEAEAAHIAEMDQAAMHSGRAQSGSVDTIRQGENEFWYLSSRIPILTQSGSALGLLSVRRDITDIKVAEAAARRRAEEILIAAEIARDSTSILDVDELLHKSVDLVREKFGYYHASIFLVDAIGEYAVLREATGEAGRQMKKSEHKLALGSRSIVGQSTQKGEAIIVRDVRDDPTHFPNPLLPETRAEMAIPLKIGDRVLGSLDVQSNKPGVFTPTDVSILSILADQLAVAVNNADLFTRMQDMLTKHRLLHQVTAIATTSESLTEALDQVANGLRVSRIADRIAILLMSNKNDLTAFALAGFSTTTMQTRMAMGHGLVGAAALSRKPIRVSDVRLDPRYIRSEENTLSEMVLPIMFADEFMGVLNMESDQLAFFSENDQEIMAALANNLGAIISNYRLVVQIRRQIERQQTLFNATSRIRRSVDMQTILQTTVDEIGHALGARWAHIDLTVESQPSSTSDISLTHPPAVNNGKNGSGKGEN